MKLLVVLLLLSLNCNAQNPIQPTHRIWGHWLWPWPAKYTHLTGHKYRKIHRQFRSGKYHSLR